VLYYYCKSISTVQRKNESLFLKFEDTCWVEIDLSTLWLWLLVRNQRCPTRSLYSVHPAKFQIVAGNHEGEVRALGEQVILKA
jgi:hypothetical protein